MKALKSGARVVAMVATASTMRPALAAADIGFAMGAVPMRRSKPQT